MAITYETNDHGESVKVTTTPGGHVVRELNITPAQETQTDSWHIAVGPFFDRFGAQKIPILASTDPVIKAIVLDCSVRKYIDLTGRRSDIESALDTIVAKGFPIDKSAILDTIPAAEERP